MDYNLAILHKHSKNQIFLKFKIKAGADLRFSRGSVGFSENC